MVNGLPLAAVMGRRRAGASLSMRQRMEEFAMDLQYQLKAGSYYLYDLSETPSAVTGQRRYKLQTSTVAVAFNCRTGKIHEHGAPARIQSWAAHTRRRLRAAGADEEANDLVVVDGPWPVDELNKCLWSSVYCRRIFQRIASLPHGKWPCGGERMRRAA